MLPRASAALAACLKRLDRLGLAISRQSFVARCISALIDDGAGRMSMNWSTTSAAPC
jgi:hypothetical protein